MKPDQPLQFESCLDRFPGKGAMHYIDVPDEVAHQFTTKRTARIICTINGVTEFQCALMPKGGGQFFINIGRRIRDESSLVQGQQLTVSIRKDDSDYGMEMPEELRELLLIDQEGNRRFHELTPGRQRSLMYWISSAKSVQIRIDRAIEQLDILKRKSAPGLRTR